MTDYIKREDLLKLYDLGGLEVENAKVPLNVVIQTIKDMPSADVVTREQYEQIHWERDVALHQLEEIGKALGEKMDDVIERIDDTNTSNALNALEQENKEGKADV